VLLPTLFGIGTAVPVLVFAFIITFATQYVGKAYNVLTGIERWFRVTTGVVFIVAGVYYVLTHIYGVSF
jgi:cytochrome c-type biogenesis protein